MADEQTPAEEPQRRKLDVHVPDELKQGSYANLLVVTHGPHEFTLDFAQFQQGGGDDTVRAEVVQRIRIAPTMVAQVLQTLNTNLTRYEERFGQVKALG